MTDKNQEGVEQSSIKSEEEKFLELLNKFESSNFSKITEDLFTELQESSLTDIEMIDSAKLLVSESSINDLKQAMIAKEVLGNDISLFEEEVVFDRKTLAKLITEPVLIEYDHKTDSLKFNGVASGLVENVLKDIESIKPADADQWLSDRLPDPTFSTTYSNNRIMEKEARAVYKLLIYSSICENDWGPEFVKLLRDYDYEKLEVKEGSIERFKNFSEMLSFVSSNARLLGKYVLSACNTKFIKQKKPTDPGFVSLLNSAEVSELEKLGIMRNNLIKASKIALQNVEMSWQKGQINYELKLRLDNIFNGNYDDGDVFNKGSNGNLFKGVVVDASSIDKSVATKFKKVCGLLFKASLLNTEALSEADVSAINKIVNDIARRDLNIPKNTIVPKERYDDFKNLVAKLKKYAVKLRVAQYKRDAVSKIREAKDNIDDVLIRSKR